MSFLKKQEKPKFFGGLLGSITRAISPLAGAGLGGYLGSLSTNPYLIAGGTTAGHYIGQKGGEALADAFEQYMPFKQGGQVMQVMKENPAIQSVSNIQAQRRADRLLGRPDPYDSMYN